jgi:hypothetical protein
MNAIEGTIGPISDCQYHLLWRVIEAPRRTQ